MYTHNPRTTWALLQKKVINCLIRVVIRTEQGLNPIDVPDAIIIVYMSTK